VKGDVFGFPFHYDFWFTLYE